MSYGFLTTQQSLKTECLKTDNRIVLLLNLLKFPYITSSLVTDVITWSIDQGVDKTINDKEIAEILRVKHKEARLLSLY